MEKIKERIAKYKKFRDILAEEYATNPSIEKQLDETDLILSTLQFCLNCLEEN